MVPCAARYCPYVPAELKVSASPTLQALRAPRGVDCTYVASPERPACAIALKLCTALPLPPPQP
jgi:hypothetical protein